MNFSRLARTLCLTTTLGLLLPVSAHASQHPVGAATAPEGTIDFLQWPEVQAFVEHMHQKHGFPRAELTSLFAEVRHSDRAIKLMMPAPSGRPKNWQAYRDRFIDPVRIGAGVSFWEAHQSVLERAYREYGVPPEIIVAIIGVETVYGRHTGNFRVLDVLTTLGFDYPEKPNREARMRFFRGELENALLYAREAEIDPLSLRGSYAGAIGWPQFMPGSILRWAVDFDLDGRVDLRGSPVDAIGSVANYLVQHGWRAGEPLVFPVTVADTDRAWEAFIGQGLEAKFSLQQLKHAGVRPALEPPADLPYGLVDLQNGANPTEYWLAANNFFVITQYNRSYFYAMSVVELARAVRVARSYQAHRG